MSKFLDIAYDTLYNNIKRFGTSELLKFKETDNLEKALLDFTCTVLINNFRTAPKGDSIVSWVCDTINDNLRRQYPLMSIETDQEFCITNDSFNDWMIIRKKYCFNKKNFSVLVWDNNELKYIILIKSNSDFSQTMKKICCLLLKDDLQLDTVRLQETKINV